MLSCKTRVDGFTLSSVFLGGFFKIGDISFHGHPGISLTYVSVRLQSRQPVQRNLIQFWRSLTYTKNRLSYISDLFSKSQTYTTTGSFIQRMAIDYLYTVGSARTLSQKSFGTFAKINLAQKWLFFPELAFRIPQQYILYCLVILHAIPKKISHFWLRIDFRRDPFCKFHLNGHTISYFVKTVKTHTLKLVIFWLK